MNRFFFNLLRNTLVLLAFGLCGVTRADDKPAVALPESLSVSTNLLGVTLNLFMVLAAIILLAWIFKRAQGFGQPASGSMRVTATLPLGPKERIFLLQVGDEHVVVGASSAGLNTLHVLNGPPLDLPDQSAGFASVEGTETFRDKLLRSIRGAAS